MRSISTLTYTNVSLTVLILLLLALVARPLLGLPAAHAADMGSDVDLGKGEAQSRVVASQNPNADNADAIKDCASAIREVAAAINKSAAAQTGIATAFSKLGQDDKPAVK